MNEELRWEDLVAIGEVARAQGREGEVIVNVLTDFPERFSSLRRVFVEEGGDVVSLAVEWTREQGGRPVVKFRGVASISEAERLAGRELRIPAGELVSLPEDSFYHFQILGYEVWDERSGYLGSVEDVLPTGGTDVLVVRGAAGEEVLIPICKEILRRIDGDAGRIEVAAPEGLVELNAR